MSAIISGFSKCSKQEKIQWIADQYFEGATGVKDALCQFLLSDASLQTRFDAFSENTVSNFMLPYGVAPNLIVNDRTFALPMATEESSVVAAASSAAKFWSTRGGFHAEVAGVKKIGQVHFTWQGAPLQLQALFPRIQAAALAEAEPVTANMKKRGGGVLDVELLDLNHIEKEYYQLRVSFDTCDSMGANFINTVLESFAKTLKKSLVAYTQTAPEILMAILSNYTPDCLARAYVECPVATFGEHNGVSGADLAEKFRLAVRIASLDPYRAVTHNKGIFNGIDAVVIATGNDFRAVEACGHAYAARDGQYRSLSHCEIVDGVFRFSMEIPLALGAVGGLTQLHPLAKFSLQLLGSPSAKELMMIVAAAGLAQNFAAVRSLVTSGIQQGHMKMHLGNMLNHFEASETEDRSARAHFQDKLVSFNGVREFLTTLRKAPYAN